jgi:hypothetical protein
MGCWWSPIERTSRYVFLLDPIDRFPTEPVCLLRRNSEDEPPPAETA